jgi:hypothetical protein
MPAKAKKPTESKAMKVARKLSDACWAAHQLSEDEQQDLVRLLKDAQDWIDAGTPDEAPEFFCESIHHTDFANAIRQTLEEALPEPEGDEEEEG